MSKFYDVLGVTVGSDPGQVKAAFHALAKCSHPDVNTGDATAEKRFKDVNEAYQILSDPERRSAYDLGIKHKDSEVHRRVRSAMAVTAASFMITVGCGLYFLLSDATHQFVGRRQSTELPTKYGSQPKQEILRQGVESLARVSPEPFSDITQSERAGKNDKVHTHGATASASVPQPAAERDKDGRPAAAPDANERESTVAVTRGPQFPQPDPEAQREQALRLHAKGLEQIARGNVSGARMFFALAAKAGSTRSMRALAGTYDPVKLSKLKVLGMQADIDAAQKWHQKTEREAAVKAEQSKTNVIVQARAGADQQSDVNKGEEERRANKLNQRGKQLLAESNVTAARSFFRAAAEAGDAEAALAMGGTYDPNFWEHGARGMKPDIAAANFWYRRALDLGAKDALDRIDQLRKR